MLHKKAVNAMRRKKTAPPPPRTARESGPQTDIELFNSLSIPKYDVSFIPARAAGGRRQAAARSRQKSVPHLSMCGPAGNFFAPQGKFFREYGMYRGKIQRSGVGNFPAGRARGYAEQTSGQTLHLEPDAVADHGDKFGIGGLPLGVADRVAKELLQRL